MSVQVTVTGLDVELAQAGTFERPHATQLVGAKVRLALSIDDHGRRRSVLCDTEDELNGEELQALSELLDRIQARLAGAYQRVIDGAATKPAPDASGSPG
jgi:hypothetical protein